MDLLSPQELLDTVDELLETLEQYDECSASVLEIAYLLREELQDSFSSFLDD